MLVIGRRKSQGQLARAELDQGVGHLIQAATYAARGAGATVRPRVRVARKAVAPTAARVRDQASRGWESTITALAPLTTGGGAWQAGSAAKKAKNMRMTQRKKSRRRGSMMTGALVAAAMAGVAGVLAMRRRRDQQEWTEHEPARDLGPARDEGETLVVETGR